MGLNHQLASLSCALSEAFFLGRTMLMPDRMCLFGLHTERWPGQQSPGEQCVPLQDMLDVKLLSQLVPVQVLQLGDQSQRAQVIGEARTAHVQQLWSSQRVASSFPCAGGPALVKRRVDRFWFQQCTSRTTDSRAILRRIHELIGTGASAPLPLNVLLRSGLFFSQQIKWAAAAVRRKIGAPYVSIHVRRSDKLKACSPEDCKSRDELTRANAIGRALNLWFPKGSDVYVGSTERPAYFELLRRSYKLHFAEDFAAELVNVSGAPREQNSH